MKTIEISTLDHAPQVVAEWLNSLSEDLGWHDKARAYMLLRATLHALRDFLTVNEAVDLAAQLPVLLRGVYYEGWIPAKTPAHPRGKEAFLARVEAPFVNAPLEESEDCVVAVFDLMRRRLSAGELGQVAHALRKPLRELWA